MFKKIIFVLLAAVVAANYANAAGVGFYAAAGNGTQNVDFNHSYIPGGSGSMIYSKTDPGTIILNFGMFYEIPGLFEMSDNSFLGVSAEYGLLHSGEVLFETSYPPYNFSSQLKMQGYTIPVTFYYKYKTSKRFAVKGGLGFTYLSLDWRTRTGSFNGSNMTATTKSDSKVMPHIGTGIEWIFSRFVTLGGELTYGFNGKMSADYVNPAYTEKYTRDFSGLVMKLVLRVYVLQ